MKEYALVIIVVLLVLLYTLYMGLQDGANAIATPISSGSMTYFETMLIALIFNIFAPILIFKAGNISVAKTIQKSIIYGDSINSIAQNKPILGIIFVLCAMFSATLWLIITSLIHIPSSSSHAMLGGIIGASIPIYGFSSLNGMGIFLKVVLVAFLTPLIAMFISYLIMQLMKLIAKYLTSRFMYVILFFQRVNVGILSSSIAINDVMKSVGIFFLLDSATLNITKKLPFKISFTEIEMVTILSVVFAFGLLIGGKKMIYTIGNKIYQINRFDSFVVQISSQTITFTSSLIGLPVSTGQITSSSVIGIGAASDMNLVKWGVSKKIVINWIITLPLTIFFGSLVTLTVKGIMNL